MLMKQSDIFTYLNSMWLSVIPRRDICEQKSAHPWVNQKCLQAIALKNSKLGTDMISAACEQCSSVFFEEFLEHVERMRDKLLQDKRGSKQ